VAISLLPPSRISPEAAPSLLLAPLRIFRRPAATLAARQQA
jgi:hypothetical protein